ncbi:hypothetical protein HDF16_002014 [Granulicella aggregans]|uniref:Uncharacterized protein n=1 Tax=Granulicella aggregans TaxID=474949 RepID=A0A7W7ZD18_9BACT|nr:hypothetical protein [Granulicella aggregans]MBB5057329.1 hypothetical protein [Granulicella aggregans]
MFSIDLPEATYRRMELVSEPRIEKGIAADAFSVPSSFIELSDPQHLMLQKTAVDGDKELEAFLAANDGRYRYDYVRLGCSFGPQNGERFEKAWLKVELKPEAPVAVDPVTAVHGPIAWSIFPVDTSQELEESTSTKFGSTAKLLSAEIGSSTKIAKKLYSMKGYREGKANPFWELYSNQADALDGVVRFHMVVRSPVAVATLGAVRLEAVISNRSYVIFREQRAFDETPSAEFVLPGV